MRISPGAGRRKERRRSSKASDKRWRALAGASLPNVVVDLFHIDGRRNSLKGSMRFEIGSGDHRLLAKGVSCAACWS